MRSYTLSIAMIPALFAQAAVIPAQAPPTIIYIVTRAGDAASRALFSARLIKLNLTKLHWYEDAAVVRAEAPEKSLGAVRADPDVILVLSDRDRSAQESEVSARENAPVAVPILPGLPSQSTGCVLAEVAPPLTPMNQMPPVPMAGTGMGMGSMGMSGIGLPGMGAGMGMGATSLVDSVAGGMAMRLLNRTPSCKISVSRNEGKFTAAGGDGSIEIKASGSCAWQAQSSVPWIKIVSGAGVSGSGVVNYTVDAGEHKARSGSIYIVATAGGSGIKGKASQIVMQTE